MQASIHAPDTWFYHKYIEQSWINPLWPSDAIWQPRFGSTLAQVVNKDNKPLPELNQCYVPSVRSSDIHPRAISQKKTHPSIIETISIFLRKISLKYPRGQEVDCP